MNEDRKKEKKNGKNKKMKKEQEPSPKVWEFGGGEEEKGEEEKELEWDDEPIPNKEELTRRLKKVAKIIDILEFVDSCLIVSERLVRDEEEAKEIIHKIRENILSAETLFTDYLITGNFPKIQ